MISDQLFYESWRMINWVARYILASAQHRPIIGPWSRDHARLTLQKLTTAFVLHGISCDAAAPFYLINNNISQAISVPHC